MMNEFEREVQRIARDFAYPPAPVIHWRRSRTVHLPLARALAALVVMIAVVMISPLRASVLDWLQIGVVRIFVGEVPTPAPTLQSLIDLYGETTLDEARQTAGFPLRLPADFGPPDHVYHQTADGNGVVMVWLAKNDHPAVSLYEFGANSGNVIYGKFLSYQTNTQVNGQPAIWTDIPHLLQYRHDGAVVERQDFLVQGNVLIWYDDSIDVTYRLESDLTMDEAIAMAVSLR